MLRANQTNLLHRRANTQIRPLPTRDSRHLGRLLADMLLLLHVGSLLALLRHREVFRRVSRGVTSAGCEGGLLCCAYEDGCAAAGVDATGTVSQRLAEEIESWRHCYVCVICVVGGISGVIIDVVLLLNCHNDGLKMERYKVLALGHVL